MGLMVLVLGLILFLGPHVFVTMRPQRAAAVKQLGEWPYKVLFAVVSIAGLYVTGKGFGMYDAGRPAGVVDCAGLDPAYHRSSDAAGLHFRCRGLSCGQYQTRPQTPHADRRENLGGGASRGQRRCRRDHPVRIGVWPGPSMIGSPSSTAAIPGDRRFRKAD